MWVQRSVIQYRQQGCTIRSELAPLSPSGTGADVIWADLTLSPLHKPTTCSTNTYFLPEFHVRSRLLQGPGGSWLNLWLPPLPYPFFPNNPELPSKSFLDPVLNLILLTGRLKSERQNGLLEVKQPLKSRHLGLIPHFSVSRMIPWCLLHTCHQILAHTGQANNLETLVLI